MVERLWDRFTCPPIVNNKHFGDGPTIYLHRGQMKEIVDMIPKVEGKPSVIGAPYGMHGYVGGGFLGGYQFTEYYTYIAPTDFSRDYLLHEADDDIDE